MKKLLLVVDDDSTIRALLHRIISTNFPEYEISLANNGKEAVDTYLSSESDLIFMDIAMPVMSGLEATRDIRKYEKENGKEKVPILAVTALDDSESIKHCFEVGMNQVIAKPFETKDVVEAIENWMR